MKKILTGTGLLFLWFLIYQVPSVFLGIAMASVEYPYVEWIASIIGFVLYIVLIWYCHRYYKKLKMTVTGVNKKLENIWLPILLFILLFVCEILFPGEGGSNQQTIVEMVYMLPVQTFFLTVVFAPILEEYIFRGFLRYYFFPTIQQNDQLILYGIVSAALFAVIHRPATFLQFLVYFVMGLSFTWMYMTKRNIYHSIALHALNNLIGFMLITMV